MSGRPRRCTARLCEYPVRRPRFHSGEVGGHGAGELASHP